MDAEALLLAPLHPVNCTTQFADSVDKEQGTEDMALRVWTDPGVQYSTAGSVTSVPSTVMMLGFEYGDEVRVTGTSLKVTVGRTPLGGETLSLIHAMDTS
jgi:hypothetical protein